VLGALLGGGLIITSFPTKTIAQDNAKQPINKPAGKQTEITMAAASKLPANTYTVPARDGEGVKTAETTSKLAPSPRAYGEKFCEANVKDDTVKIKIRIDNIVHYFDVQTSLFGKIGLPNASNKDIAAVAYDRAHNKVHFITRKGILSLTLDMNEIRNAKTVGAKIENNKFDAICPPDTVDLFTGINSFYVSEDGSRIFIANPFGFIIQKPEYKNCFPWTSLGKKNPITNPTIDSEDYAGKTMVRIRDPTMKMNNGKNYKVFFDLDTFEVGSFEY